MNLMIAYTIYVIKKEREYEMSNSETVLLSICIPTYKRPEIIRKLIKSIISQDVDHSLYEIRITDNSDTDETAQVMKEFADVDNLHYKKVFCQGFYNSWEALKFGEGRFLKLHNDYSIFKEHALIHMIDTIKANEKDHAQVFFSLGKLDDVRKDATFLDYDSFMDCISFWATWSLSFSIWKTDFDRICAEGIIPDHMYPHTSFLHRLTNKDKYVVDNEIYVDNIEPAKKGGYNLVDNFGRIYLSMVIEELLQPGYISEKTYKKIRDGILYFCADWFYTVKENPEKYTFTFDGDDQIILSRLGSDGLKLYMAMKKKRKIKSLLKLAKRKIKN